LGSHGAINQDTNAEIPAELLMQEGVNAIRIRGSNRAKSSSIRDGISSGRYDQEDYY
jgi:hypothetical protein